ncbi:hypothetical protein FXV77_07725 [Sphingobacterium phlebotomi]|jgi:hypothetical protein|uniref:Uncharacterized protein n=1 Tax=Sphingobacterium phlebotomi TaxID=2605433 RepID=A0A5D4H9Y2_9SPHI|nr:hypothetical protein [Sphingobacterium phlebotomi]TYR37053.1 hypothetical protein FXV77_07725 [Sphingobacterium phlebotomi]HLT86619.1 hypothetical protein [Sphingobacterium sp.]
MMENKINKLDFKPDFIQACEIFDLEPHDVLQKFIDSVSIPYFIANPMNPDRWANTFMVECILTRLESEELLERYSVFFDRITEAVLNDMENKDQVAREIMDEWHRAVLEDRIEDVMKKQ